MLKLLLAGAVFLLSAQSRYSPLFAAIGTPEYPGETYTSRASGDATRVYFDQEPIGFGITIANRTASGQGLKLVPDRDGNIFEIRVTSDRAGTTSVGLGPVLSSGARLKADLATEEININSAVNLAPSERIQWALEIPASLPPGEYSITAKLRGTDSEGRELLWQVDTVMFEVRDSKAAPAEVEYREAIRLSRADDPADRARAEAAVARLLRIHPNSYAAHLMMASLEERRGRSREAQRHLERASQLLEQNADLLLLKFKTPEQIERLKSEMKARRDQ